MSSFLARARGHGRYMDGDGGQGQALENSQTSAASDPFAGYSYPSRPKDRNATDHRLQFNSKCIYERALPGNAYITCHVDRLQKGYYDSAQVHEDAIENVRFVALHFVFHAATTVNRFKKATITVSVRKGQEQSGRLSKQRRHSSYSDASELKRQRINPSIIRHAPHVLYGAISPETLQWNFNLAGSLGVSQGPASAKIEPSGGYKGSYKVYEMLRIQGSSRTYRGNWGPEDDVEDGEVVWTLEENTLQRSGIPREFTFIILLQKGDPDVETLFNVSVEPRVNSHMGTFPSWLINLPQYRPLPKEPFNLDHEIGQTFEPCMDKERGFNFANLSCSFEDFVALPGTTYTTNDALAAVGEAGMQTDTTKTPTANSLQNSITLGQAKLPPSSTGQQKALYAVPEQSPHMPQGQQHQQQQQNTANQANQSKPSAPREQVAPPPRPQSAMLPTPPSWQYPQYPSLFPDNTLNVRVFIERAASPSSSSPAQDRSKDVSARRPQSLRRSRSRTGLEKEFGETQVNDMQSAAQRYMAEQAARVDVERRRMSAGTPMREKSHLDRVRDKEFGPSPLMNPRVSAIRERLARPPGSRMSYPSARNVSA